MASRIALLLVLALLAPACASRKPALPPLVELAKPAPPILIGRGAQPDPALSEGEFETAVRVPLAELWPGQKAFGPGYQLPEEVPIVDYLGQFRLRTDVGELEAHGVYELRQRLAELPAARELDRLANSAVFADAIQRGAARPIESARLVISEPTTTVARLPAGIGRFLLDRALDVRDLALRVSDAAARAREDDEDTEGAPERPASERAKDAATAATLRWLGYHKARRDIARHVGVDPYTTNPLIAERLDTLAWAAWTGGRLSGLAWGQVGGLAGEALDLATDARRYAWELPAEDLERRNLGVLAELGIRGRLARDLIYRGKAFTLTQQTEFVELLRLPLFDASRMALFRLALLAGREIEGRFIVHSMRLLLLRARDDTEPLATTVLGTTPALVRPDGGYVVALPVDYLHFSPEIARFAWREDFLGRHNELLVTGTLSPAARDNFSLAGWTVRERVPLVIGEAERSDGAQVAPLR
jgi:hypothetical protein